MAHLISMNLEVHLFWPFCFNCICCVAACRRSKSKTPTNTKKADTATPLSNHKQSAPVLSAEEVVENGDDMSHHSESVFNNTTDTSTSVVKSEPKEKTSDDIDKSNNTLVERYCFTIHNAVIQIPTIQFWFQRWWYRFLGFSKLMIANLILVAFTPILVQTTGLAVSLFDSIGVWFQFQCFTKIMILIVFLLKASWDSNPTPANQARIPIPKSIDKSDFYFAQKLLMIWKWDGRNKETCKRFYSKYKIPVNHVICEWLIFTHSSMADISSVTCLCSPNLVQKKLLPLFKRSAASNTKAGDKDQMVIVSTLVCFDECCHSFCHLLVWYLNILPTKNIIHTFCCNFPWDNNSQWVWVAMLYMSLYQIYMMETYTIYVEWK